MTGRAWGGQAPHNVSLGLMTGRNPFASNRSSVTVELFIGLEIWHCCLSVSHSDPEWGVGGPTLVLGKAGKSIKNKGFHTRLESCGLMCACLSVITETMGECAAGWTRRCIIHTGLTLSVLSFLAGQPPSTGCSM